MRRGLPGLLLVSLVAIGCGGRSQIEFDPDPFAKDASVDGPQILGDAASDGAGGAPADAAEEEAASGGGGGNPIGQITACVGCIQQSCPGVMTCLTDTACRNGLVCLGTKCLGGGGGGGGLGGLDIQCALGCFNGDLSSAMNAFTGVQCLFTTCGTDCPIGNLLGDGGLGGLGGIGGGGLPGGSQGAAASVCPSDQAAYFEAVAKLQSVAQPR